MPWFKHLFKKKEPQIPFNFSTFRTDLHSHLIPGIDDGSKSLDDSELLARGLVELGYKNAITTPHIMSDFYKNNPEIIRSGLQHVTEMFQQKKLNLQIQAAAEYYIDFEFVAKIGKEELLTFGDNNILVEFSFVEPPKAFKEAFFALQTNGYKPILAHPERYLYWSKDRTALYELKDRDILFQTNILSLKGVYGPEVTDTTLDLIDKKMINFFGTDLHNQNQLEALKTLRIPQSLSEKIAQLDIQNSRL